ISLGGEAMLSSVVRNSFAAGLLPFRRKLQCAGRWPSDDRVTREPSKSFDRRGNERMPIEVCATGRFRYSSGGKLASNRRRAGDVNELRRSRNRRDYSGKCHVRSRESG